VASLADILRQLQVLSEATGTEGISHFSAPGGVSGQILEMAARAGIEPGPVSWHSSGTSVPTGGYESQELADSCLSGGPSRELSTNYAPFADSLGARS
jgi:hypothetical protein